VKLGVRQLVSADGKPGPLTEQERAMVTQNDHVTFTSPSAGARQQALDQPTPLPAWTSEHDLELNGSGEELLETIGWDGFQENEEANDAPVSNGLYQPSEGATQCSTNPKSCL
jgi:hypothetical protein